MYKISFSIRMSIVNSIGMLGLAIGVAGAINHLNLTGALNPLDWLAKLISDTLLGKLYQKGENKNKPILWFVIDDYGTNNRRWVDFGARSSRDLNMGFLSITKAKCYFTQGDDFDIRLCLGRADVARVIYENGGVVPDLHLSAPPELWKAWARSALLSSVGGLYLDGLSLCLGPSFMSDVSDKTDAVFGTDHDELKSHTYDGACSPHAGWASGPGHASWVSYNNNVVAVINAGHTTWTSAIARRQLATWYDMFLRNSMSTVRHSEWSRKFDGRPLELEDLFDRTMTNEWKPPLNAIYLPLDYETINRSVTYKWFLSLSAEEILNPKSRFLWSSLSQNIRHHK